MNFPQSIELTVQLTEADVQSFAALTGDQNALHVDSDYARGTEFGAPVAHGALLVGQVSRVLGMHIPGRNSLVLSMNVRFAHPAYYPASLRVRGRLASFNPSREEGQVVVTVEDAKRGWVLLESKVLFRLHSQKALAPPTATRSEAQPPASGRGKLLVTGASGGIGSLILRALTSTYPVLCPARRWVDANGRQVEYIRLDLEDQDALEGFLQANHPADFYGVVHLSAPPMRQAFVSDDPDGLAAHLYHALQLPARLARWARAERSAVRRMVLVGSAWGTRAPRPQNGAYSLAKAAMEHLARLLAVDLAATGATVNIILPSLIPAGINEGLSERARASAAGRMPTGRLVEVPDLANVVLFLLSDAAAQINGTSIALDGGGAGA